jgi:hypothetical protein
MSVLPSRGRASSYSDFFRLSALILRNRGVLIDTRTSKAVCVAFVVVPVLVPEYIRRYAVHKTAHTVPQRVEADDSVPIVNILFRSD